MRVPTGTCDFRRTFPHLGEWPRVEVVATFLASRVLLIDKGENDENLYAH
jgi:hypothetical protein